MMNFEQARLNMVAQQIRTWDVLDQAVLDCIAAIPRDEFVPVLPHARLLRLRYPTRLRRNNDDAEDRGTPAAIAKFAAE